MTRTDKLNVTHDNNFIRLEVPYEGGSQPGSYIFEMPTGPDPKAEAAHVRESLNYLVPGCVVMPEEGNK